MPPQYTPGGNPNPPRRRRRKRKPSTIDGAVQEFMREHGPIAMRTADTPWQAKQRPRRKKERIRKQRYEQLVRGSNKFGELEPRSLRAGVGVEGILRAPVHDEESVIGKAWRESGEFFTEDIPGLIEDAFPGLGSSQIRGRIGSKTYDLLPTAKTPMGKVVKAQTAGLLGQATGALASIPAQWANAFLGTPGFAYMALTDPLGTAQLMVESFKDQIEHPMENLGYLSIAFIGAFGAGRGIKLKAPKITRALAKGDVTEAVRIAKGSPVRRGKHGSPQEISRVLPDGETVTSYGITLPPKAADKIALPGRTGRTRAQARGAEADILTSDLAALYKAGRNQTNAEGLAIWAVNSRRPMRDVVAAFQHWYKNTKKPAAKRRLRELVKNANEALRYTEDVPGPDGRLVARIKPEFADLARIQEWGARVSREMGERKAIMDEVGETAARYGVPREAQAQRLENQYQAFGLPGEESLLAPEGMVFTPGKTPRGASVVIPTRSGRDTVGVPKGESRHAFTGASIREGTLDPKAARAIAREGLESRKIILRYDTWQKIIDDPGTITASELADLVASKKIPLRELMQWRAVRVKTGTNRRETKAAIERFFTKDSIFSESLGGRRGALEDLRAIAAEADAAGQVRFFDNRKWKIQTVQLARVGTSPLGQLWQTINSLAKVGVLFSKMTGYIVPQVLGMIGMQLMEQGLGGPVRMLGQAPFIWKALPAHARARIEGVRGTGIGHSLDPAGQPINPVRVLNQTLADLFGIAIDAPFRNSSIFYWADQLGYGARRKGGRIDTSRLERLLTAEPNTKEFQDLLRLRDLVDGHYGRFSRLGPMEQQIAQLIFFYPWLRASTIYAATLPKNHPVRTAIVAQGGKVSQERTEDLLVQAIMEKAGLGEEQAQEATEGIMRTYPGIFVTGTDEQGNPKVVTPQSAALLQMPSDILQLIDGFMGPEPLKQPLRMGTPGVSVLGAALPGGYDPYFGEPMYDTELGMWGRMAEEAKSWVPALTLYKRLTEEPSDSAQFTYTPGQAVGQYVFPGSIGERGLNIKNVARQALKDSGADTAKSGPGRTTSGEFSQKAIDVQWARRNKDVPRDVVRYAINARKMADRLTPELQKLAKSKGLTNTEKLSDADYYKTKLRIINRLRPGTLSAEERAYLEKLLDEGGVALEEAVKIINPFFTYEDLIGRSVFGLIDDYRTASG